MFSNLVNLFQILCKINRKKPEAKKAVFNNDFLAGTNFIKNYVNRHPRQLVCDDTNFFDKNVNLFNMFLTNFNSSIEFAICSGIPSGERSYHMESSRPICNTSPLANFCTIGDFSGGYSQTDCSFNFNINCHPTGWFYSPVRMRNII